MEIKRMLVVIFKNNMGLLDNPSLSVELPEYVQIEIDKYKKYSSRIDKAVQAVQTVSDIQTQTDELSSSSMQEYSSNLSYS